MHPEHASSSLILTFVLDMTTQKEMERQMQFFLGMTSHELKIPLMALKGIFQLLQRKKQRLLSTQFQLDPKIHTFFETLSERLTDAVRQVDIQTRFINDLLDLSRIQAGTLKLEVQPCDLVSIVKITMEDLRLTASGRTLQLTLPTQTTVIVLADQDRIRQVLTNYVTNALRYSGPSLPIVVGLTLQPGLYPIRSGFGVRKWLGDQMMAISLSLTNTLYATLYLIPFLRLLGARVGRWAEVSTVGDLDPDMLELGNESFVADIAVIAPAVFHAGCVVLAPAVIGDRSFIGNGALIPINTQIDEHCLIGVYSVPPAQVVKAGTSWLGAPAIFLPRRQESQSFQDDLIYRPRISLLAWRLFIEFFRVTLPGTILAFTTLFAFYTLLTLGSIIAPLALLCVTPLLMWGIGVASTLVVVLLKWIIIGRYRPRVEPLWSVFVRRSELITALYEAVAVPALIGALTGTPWIAPILRLFGARIGRRVWLDTTFLTEFDLVEVGDDAAVGESTSLQTHLFEDRVMKMSTVKVGAASSVGSCSVVLYDAEVGDGAALDALSLAMKGETLPPGSHWRGIPARSS